MEFVTGGLAAVAASFFTNPLEVIKTRLQLQGELKARGLYTVHYKNFFHAFYTVAKADGILALQKGLVPGAWYQLVLNGTRLGTYQIAEKIGWTLNSKGKLSLTKASLIAMFGGCAANVIGSPLYLVKTHLQSQAQSSIAVGYQHGHSSMTRAFVEIYRKHGITGLWRGVGSAMPRSIVGSPSQLVSFQYCKEILDNYEIFKNHPIFNSFASAIFGGFVVTVFIMPFDVVKTRMYNQGTDSTGRGLLYSNFRDCFMKIWRSEGLYGFYKGFVPSYARLGPHTVLCLVFWDALKKLDHKLKAHRMKTVSTISKV